MITPVLDFLLKSKGDLDKATRAFDSMLTESLKMLFSIAGETDSRAMVAWNLVSENGGSSIFDLRKRQWGITSDDGIYYMRSGSVIWAGHQELLWFRKDGIEAFYFDDHDDGKAKCGWYLFSVEDKKNSKQEGNEDGTKEENGNMH